MTEIALQACFQWGSVDAARPARDCFSMAKKVVARFKSRVRHFIRQWREYRGLTQEQLAERVDMSVSNISQLERGLQGFSDEGLGLIAHALNTEPGYLLTVDPTRDEAMWSIWENAKPGERKMIVEIAKTLVKTGT